MAGEKASLLPWLSRKLKIVTTMKKIKIFSALALTLVMASCENFDLPNPPGQTNTDPDAYFENSGLALANVSSEANLPQANADNKFVTVANITELKDFPSAYTLSIDMEVGNDASFSNTSTIATEISGNDVTVNPALLNGAIQSTITKKPGTYDANVRFVAYAERENTRIRLGGVDAYYATGVLKTVTMPADKVIEDSYYVVPCDADGKPDFASAIEMTNTAGSGLSGYDAPEFAVKLFSPADGYDFMIAPASAMVGSQASELFGCNPAEDGLSGKLAVGYAAGHVNLSGDVLITINMEQDSYTVNYAFEVLYPYSGATSAAKLMLLYTSNYINYSGVAAINNQWFLGTTADKKEEPLFKMDTTTDPTLSEDGLTQTGLLSSSSATLITTPLTGNHLYWVDVNLVKLEYSLTAINTLSVIGAANGWSHETSTDLTPSKEFKTWTATDVHMGPEFKIAANKAWDIDFGGVKLSDTEGEIVYNVNYKGGNLEVEEGNYDIVLDFTVQPYVLTLKKH